MIKSVSRHNLFMDFSNIKTSIGKPSDIDMFFIGNSYLVIGEIKNELGNFTKEQKWIYETLADNLTIDAYILFLHHDKYVEKGDKVVDVSKTIVKEIYCKGLDNQYKWFKTNMTCQEMLNKIEWRYF